MPPLYVIALRDHPDAGGAATAAALTDDYGPLEDRGGRLYDLHDRLVGVLIEEAPIPECIQAIGDTLQALRAADPADAETVHALARQIARLATDLELRAGADCSQEDGTAPDWVGPGG